MTYRPVLNDLSTLPSGNNFLNGTSTQMAKRGRLCFALSTVAVLSNSIRAFFVCLHTYILLAVFATPCTATGYRVWLNFIMADICNGPPIENGLQNVCLNYPLPCTLTFLQERIEHLLNPQRKNAPMKVESH